MRRTVPALGLVGLLLIFWLASAQASFWTDGQPSQKPVPLTATTIADLAEKLSPAVVNIDTEATVAIGGRAIPGELPRDFREFFERFFGGQGPQTPERKQRRTGTGSGFIVTADGYLVTNNHVVEEADKITVRLLDKRRFQAKVVGRDPRTDVALLKIEATGLPHVTLGDSERLKVGEWVMAIGNPFGLDHTVTTGIVSAKGRIIGAGPYDDFIQTDASINPGNSGGPLIDLNGQVVGMNTAIIAQGQGIGFAVPINVVKQIIAQLKDKGKVTWAEMGVHIQRVTPEIAKFFGLKESKGALISQVLPGSPAEKANVKKGDIILEFNGRAVEDFRDLPKLVAMQPVGSKATVKIWRDKKELTLPVTLGESKDRAAKTPPTPGQGGAETPKLGLTVQDLTPQIAESLGLDKNLKGVVVAEVTPDSPAEQANLRRGDIITEVNRQEVKTTDDFAKIVQKAEQDKPILLLVLREGSSFYIPLKWPEK